MQDDANLCLYKSRASEWCSFTNSLGSGTSVTMQTNGNLCLHNADGSDTNCVGLSGPAAPWSYLQVRNDGTAVITDGAAVYWKVP